ncbi:hypothetical protein IWX90DRAFT_246513 [Phyllosticta citrichinensis]|uniref:DUF1479-domain-containing protein n=1 Tax=Phyllosticta citrichinensis TaxID=1130410 RepID=A0ABR1XQP6_9PEZI
MASALLNTAHRRAIPSAARFFQTVATATKPPSTQKRAGDISDAFASLSGQEFKPLDPSYALLKKNLIAGYEDAVRASWDRLLKTLQDEVSTIVALGSNVIPEVEYSDIAKAQVSKSFEEEHRKRGVAIVRGVIDENEVLSWKEELREYIRRNPHTKAFPAENPQVYELYWSPAQMRARTHANLLQTQRYILSFWNSRLPSAHVSLAHPTAYADRLRMRLPGDARFALGPHVDGGSVERWDPAGYGRGGVYDAVWQGRWEEFDPWESSGRLDVISDLHAGVGACSMFRMSQGWLSMSNTGPFEGTLLVNPLLAKATAYYLLRPFFTPKKAPIDPTSEVFEPAFLDPSNWTMESEPSSWIQGATPGHGQELRAALHPHLDLARTMVHVPRVKPGDYVVWHCDTIHAVDKVHAGSSDSSVLYIPTCPLTVENAKYLARQRQNFLEGIPSPDFGGGEGESNHVGRHRIEDVAAYTGPEGLRAMGLLKWDDEASGLSLGEKATLRKANEALGFA